MLRTDNSPLGNNPWLTGLIESDGNFYCSFNLAPRRGTKGIAGIVKSYMRISQNQIYKTSPDTLLVGVAANYSNSQIMGAAPTGTGCPLPTFLSKRQRR